MTYKKRDLEDLADLSGIDELDTSGRWSCPSRGELLVATLEISDDDYTAINHGSYQGTLLFVFETGGDLWLLKDAYGSCSHCDGLLSCDDDDEYKNYATKMFRNAYAFEGQAEAKAFLEQKAEDGRRYGWGGVAGNALEELDW